MIEIAGGWVVIGAPFHDVKEALRALGITAFVGPLDSQRVRVFPATKPASKARGAITRSQGTRAFAASIPRATVVAFWPTLAPGHDDAVGGWTVAVSVWHRSKECAREVLPERVEREAARKIVREVGRLVPALDRKPASGVDDDADAFAVVASIAGVSVEDIDRIGFQNLYETHMEARIDGPWRLHASLLRFAEMGCVRGNGREVPFLPKTTSGLGMRLLPARTGDELLDRMKKLAKGKVHPHRLAELEELIEAMPLLEASAMTFVVLREAAVRIRTRDADARRGDAVSNLRARAIDGLTHAKGAWGRAGWGDVLRRVGVDERAREALEGALRVENDLVSLRRLIEAYEGLEPGTAGAEVLTRLDGAPPWRRKGLYALLANADEPTVVQEVVSRLAKEREASARRVLEQVIAKLHV